jgi:hypothetical protein
MRWRIWSRNWPSGRKTAIVTSIGTHIGFPKQVSNTTCYILIICLIIFCQDITLAQVRLTIAKEEKERAEAGMDALHNVSASAFLLLGMDIQNIQ